MHLAVVDRTSLPHPAQIAIIRLQTPSNAVDPSGHFTTPDGIFLSELPVISTDRPALA
jgi:hypothetical protein